VKADNYILFDASNGGHSHKMGSKRPFDAKGSLTLIGICT